MDSKFCSLSRLSDKLVFPGCEALLTALTSTFENLSPKKVVLLRSIEHDISCKIFSGCTVEAFFSFTELSTLYKLEARF